MYCPFCRPWETQSIYPERTRCVVIGESARTKAHRKVVETRPEASCSRLTLHAAVCTKTTPFERRALWEQPFGYPAGPRVVVQYIYDIQPFGINRTCTRVRRSRARQYKEREIQRRTKGQEVVVVLRWAVHTPAVVGFPVDKRYTRVGGGGLEAKRCVIVRTLEPSGHARSENNGQCSALHY